MRLEITTGLRVWLPVILRQKLLYSILDVSNVTEPSFVVIRASLQIKTGFSKSFDDRPIYTALCLILDTITFFSFQLALSCCRPTFYSSPSIFSKVFKLNHGIEATLPQFRQFCNFCFQNKVFRLFVLFFFYKFRIL